MKSLIPFIFLLVSPLFGVEIPDIQASQGGGKAVTIDQRENFFQTSTSYKIAPNVNPITGDLIEEEADLVVAGVEPLSARRFYNHTAPYEPRYGGWSYNPEATLVANFEWSEQEKFAAVGEIDGSVACFKTMSPGQSYTFDVPKGFANFSPSGQCHPLNTKVNYYKTADPQGRKKYFCWNGDVTDGSGKRRSFTSQGHCWLTTVIKDINLTCYTPNVWTPYQLPINEERLPNGNIICYSYARWRGIKDYPRPFLLNSITAFNSDRTKQLGSISFHYNKDKHDDVRSITVTGSDGRQAFMHHHGSAPILLQTVVAPGKPQIAYGYHLQYIICAHKPDGRIVETQYNTASKVASQSAPVGPQGEMHPIGRYTYNDKSSEVLDAEGHKTVYHFDENKRIHALTTYQGDKVYRAERMTWDSATGNLLTKTIEDASGVILQTTEYQYDKNHNAILEKIGDGKEFTSIHRTFSEDGFNLKLTESDREGKITRYSYLPGTNLLTSELLYKIDTILTRTFHTYDNCASLIQTITDDGKSEDPNDIQGVTFRKIVQIKPKQELPCLGLPEIVQEKTLDAHGQEILLKKVIYTYANSGKILKEEHYDSTNTHRYILHNTYDEQERLISKTDPLGNTTLFTYDLNNNLLCITGPRKDQEKKITYDRANRPTCITEKQTDGSLLTTKKCYDRLGQVITQIDACGFETHFEYDSLGRVTTIHLPDGSHVQKEYDIFGNVTKEIDPLGYETLSTYNFRNQPLTIQHPDGTQESFSYTTTGTLASHTQPNGTKIVYTYDILDNPIQTDTYSPKGTLLITTKATYSPFHKLSETDPEGISTYFTYDYAGRKIAQTTGERVTTCTYDTLNHLATLQEGDYTTHHLYDLKNRLLEKRIEGEALYFQEAYAYDSADNRISITTSAGTTQTEYNSRAEPIQIIDPLGNTTTITYSYQENYTKTTTNPKGIQKIEIHDPLKRPIDILVKDATGQIIQRTEKQYDPCGNPLHTTQYIYEGPTLREKVIHSSTYGPKGRIEKFVEASSKETHYIYDNLGRLTTTIKPDKEPIHREYDTLGRLARYYGKNLDYRYTYDRKNRPLKIEDHIQNTTLERNYDIHGAVIQEKLPTGLTTKNTYDPCGRRTSLTLPDNSIVYYTYQGPFLHTISRKGYTYTYTQRNLSGKPTLITLPESCGQISITYDPALRWKNYQSPYYEADYSYDSLGNLIQHTYKDTLGKENCTYTYDDLNQLLAEKENQYTYDSLYNRTTKNQDTYSLNALSQITHDGQKKYTYDANGNLLSDEERTYEYDLLDRLIAVTTPNGVRTSYAYDPLNRRISKGWDQYIWDDQKELGMIYGRTLYELRILGEGKAEIGSAAIMEFSGYTYFPIHDSRGSLVNLIFSKNYSYGTYRYTSFGEPLTHEKLSPWRFASKRHDDETNLIYFGNRYYSPYLGRWITPDPIGFSDGPNLYAYVSNNPLIYCDPYGLYLNPLNTRNPAQFLFRCVEHTARHLMPLPRSYNILESIGRWGAGGSFRPPPNDPRIIPIPGIKIENIHHTLGNGICTFEEGITEVGTKESIRRGGVAIDILLDPSNGFVCDIGVACLRKLGFSTAYNKMCAEYYNDRYRENPKSKFISLVHSRGATALMNTRPYLDPGVANSMKVEAFGPATLIPKGSFGEVTNYISMFDLTSLVASGLGFLKHGTSNVKFLTPHSINPLSEHFLSGDTYSEKMDELGDEFKEKYLP